MTRRMCKCATVGLALVAATGCMGIKNQKYAASMRNERAPDFQLTSLDGERVQLSDLQGKPTVLVFWGYQCPPCLEEVQHLRALADEHGDRLRIVAVESWDAPAESVRRIANRVDANYTILLNGSDVLKRYNSPGVPTTLWIAPDGTVMDAKLGFDGPDALRAKTSNLLASAR